MRRRSKKTAKMYREERVPLVKRLLEERPWCQRCVSSSGMSFVRLDLAPPRRSTVIHEKLTRARGGDILDEANCVALCEGCHQFIHSHPVQSTEEGWLEERKGSKFYPDPEVF